MKNFLLLMILFVGMIAVSCTTHENRTAPPPQDVGYVMAVDQQMNAPVLNVQDEVAVPDVGGSETPTSFVDFLKSYAVELIIAFLGFLKVIVNLTPTTKDNQIFGIIDKIISWIVPNMKAGGGKFT